MNKKLLQFWDFIKTAALWSFVVLLKGLKIAVEEAIVVLNKLQTFLTKETL